MTRRPTPRALVHAAGVLVLLALVASSVVVAVPEVVGASHGYVVLSDSMSPTIRAGDAVLVSEVPPDRVHEGDVVTVRRPATDATVTHRVVGVRRLDDGLYFRTKGDANEVPDAGLVPAEHLVGVVVLAVPYVGRLLALAGSDAGLVALVVVPSVLLVAGEVRRLVAGSGPDRPPNAR